VEKPEVGPMYIGRNGSFSDRHSKNVVASWPARTGTYSLIFSVVKVKAELSLCSVKHHAMMADGGMEFYVLFTALVGGCEWSASRPGPFTLRERVPPVVTVCGSWTGLKSSTV
jgi:hypothetical protein